MESGTSQPWEILGSLIEGDPPGEVWLFGYDWAMVGGCMHPSARLIRGCATCGETRLKFKYRGLSARAAPPLDPEGPTVPLSLWCLSPLSKCQNSA